MPVDQSAVAVLTRMSVDQRRELQQAAAARGMTVRHYVLSKLFGEDVEVRQTPGRVPRRQEELPMTG